MSKPRTQEVVKNKLTEQERAAIVTAMQRHGGVERRRDLRVPLTEDFPLVARLGEGDAAQFVNVVPRDISSSGIGFYHVAYVHPGTEVQLLMKNRAGNAVKVHATVARCRHVSGRLHEVGVVFETAIQVEVFANTEPAGSDAGPKLTTEEVYKRITTVSDQLKSLASQSASLDTILERVGELAVLLAPFDAGHLERRTGDAAATATPPAATATPPAATGSNPKPPAPKRP